MRWLNLLFVLLTNGVPLYGVKLLGWSATNVLVLYWFENLLTAVFTCVRIMVHRQLTAARGYSRSNQLGLLVNGKPFTGGLLAEYATMAFVFTFAQGIFVWPMVVFAGNEDTNAAMWRFSGSQFQQGAEWIALTLALNLAIDLAGIMAWSYDQIENYAKARMGRVIVLHLTIILGMFAMLATHAPIVILYVLIALKTLSDLATAHKSATSAATKDGS
ncbi:MAG TPA: DUF6498-containing protein [Xanthomonadaceae bacterium]|nr:DUF6498-containing protein [Xanthomonadaceae bacterium]